MRIVTRRRNPLSRRVGFAVDVEGAALHAPSSCPCCGARGAHALKVRSAAGRSELIVQYCDTCHAHVSAAATRQLAVGLASLVLGGVSVVALPALQPRVSAMEAVMIGVALTLLPLVAHGVVPFPRGERHAAWGPAVRSRGALIVCASETWAAALAGPLQRPFFRVNFREARWSPLMALGLLLPLALLPAFNAFYHLPLRVVNLSEERFEIQIDDEASRPVPPSTGESPNAGIVLSVRVGERRLKVLDAAGQVLAEEQVTFQSGADHLFAPRSEGYCFWLESRAYGQVSERSATVLPLRGAQRFWALPRQVDSWFFPTPDVTENDTRSTGGLLTALRYAPCSRAPASVGSAPP